MTDSDRRIQLNMIQVVASALAAVTAAVLASFFGLAGTLIGAALVSVLATVGSAVYSHWLQRTREGLRNVSVQVRDTPLISLKPQSCRLLDRLGGLRSVNWRSVGLASVIVFVVSIGVITIVELAAGQPVAKIVGGSSPSGAGTTIGGTFSGSGGSPQPSREPEQNPSSSTTTSPSGSTTTSSTTTTTSPHSSTTTGPSTTSASTTTGVP